MSTSLGDRVKSVLARIRFNSPLTLSFTALSLVVLIADLISRGFLSTLLFSVYRAPLTDPLTYVRLFTHVLGHASFEHYFSNMMLFLIVGPIAEEKYGTKNMLLAFLLTALVSGGVHCLLSPGTALLGASGLVFMLIMLSTFAGAEKGTLPFTLLLVAALYLGQEIYTAVTAADSVSQLAHIVGGICGIAGGFLLRRKN